MYVATGDTGKIFSVAPDGKGQVFYSSEETHIRSLALDASGNVLAGTEPSGRVLRIPKAANNRRAFVLYETSKKEITALLQAANGDLYVAAVGEKTPPAPGQPRPMTADTTTTSNFVISLGPAGNPTGAPAQTQPIPFTPLSTVNSSSVYRIAPDGSPEELWSARDDVVYSMGLLPGGKLLLGTGNDGAVLELEGNHIFSKLVKATSRQVTSIAAGPGGKLFLAAANPGKVFTLGPENESEGTYESQPFDAHIFSRWGRTVWWGENIASANSAGRRANRDLCPLGKYFRSRFQLERLGGPVCKSFGRQTRLPRRALCAVEGRPARRRQRQPGARDRLVQHRLFAQKYSS